MKQLIVILFSFLVLFDCTNIITQDIDNGRTGWNSKETTLTAANIPTLKLLKEIPTASPCTTQILYYENLNLNGHKNVLFCVTNGDSDNTNTTVYAFDADTYQTVWAHYVGPAAIWATHAPAIDPTTNYLYFVYKNSNDNGYNYIMGIDIKTGDYLTGSHELINASVPGRGAANVGGVVPFQNTATSGRIHNDCRTSILIVNGLIIFGFAHNTDSAPYHGWVFAYKYDTGTQKFVRSAYFCTTPNNSEGGVWQGGQGMASDGTSFYFTTGNGAYNPSDQAYSMAVIKMSFDFTIQDYFVPAAWQQYSNGDLDLGGCGPTLIPNTKYIFVGMTKYGSVHLIDKTNMGKFTANKDSCRQTIHLANGYVVPGGNPVVFQSSSNTKIFVWAPSNPIYEFTYNPTTEMLETPPVSWTGNRGGGGLQVSSDGASNPILWALSAGDIYAFDLTKSISSGPIWTERISGPSSWGWPTISNGKIYLPGYDSNMRIYGLANSTSAF
jgi:hypothetical protein